MSKKTSNNFKKESLQQDNDSIPTFGAESIEVSASDKCSEIQAAACDNEKSTTPCNDVPIRDLDTSGTLYSEVLSGTQSSYDTKVIPSSNAELVTAPKKCTSGTSNEDNAENAVKSLKSLVNFPELKGTKKESGRCEWSTPVETQSGNKNTAQLASSFSDCNLTKNGTENFDKSFQAHKHFSEIKETKHRSEGCQPMEMPYGAEFAELDTKFAEHSIQENDAGNDFTELKPSMTDLCNLWPESTKVLKDNKNEAKKQGQLLYPYCSGDLSVWAMPMAEMNKNPNPIGRNPFSVKNDECKDSTTPVPNLTKGNVTSNSGNKNTNQFDNSTNNGGAIGNPLAIDIPAWNFTDIDYSNDDYPGFLYKYDDDNYMRHEEMAMLGLKNAMKKHKPK